MISFIKRMFWRLNKSEPYMFAMNITNINTVGELVKNLKTFPGDFKVVVYETYNGTVMEVYND